MRNESNIYPFVTNDSKKQKQSGCRVRASGRFRWRRTEKRDEVAEGEIVLRCTFYSAMFSGVE